MKRGESKVIDRAGSAVVGFDSRVHPAAKQAHHWLEDGRVSRVLTVNGHGRVLLTSLIRSVVAFSSKSPSVVLFEQLGTSR